MKCKHFSCCNLFMPVNLIAQIYQAIFCPFFLSFFWDLEVCGHRKLSIISGALGVARGTGLFVFWYTWVWLCSAWVEDFSLSWNAMILLFKFKLHRTEPNRFSLTSVTKAVLFTVSFYRQVHIICYFKHVWSHIFGQRPSHWKNIKRSQTAIRWNENRKFP